MQWKVSGKYEGFVSTDHWIQLQISSSLIPDLSHVKTHDSLELHQTWISYQACSLLSCKTRIFRGNKKRRVYAKTRDFTLSIILKKILQINLQFRWTIYLGGGNLWYTHIASDQFLKCSKEIHKKSCFCSHRFIIMSFISSKAANIFDLPTLNYVNFHIKHVLPGEMTK